MKERLFAEFCIFMQRTEPLFFADANGTKYCMVHGLKKDRYTSTILGDYTFRQLYRMAENKGIVNGEEQLHIYVCHSLGLSDDIKNDDRCILDIVTGYPIYFSWNAMADLNSCTASPDYDNEFIVETIDDDNKLLSVLEELNKHGKIQFAGSVANYLEWFKVYEREVSV